VNDISALHHHEKYSTIVNINHERLARQLAATNKCRMKHLSRDLLPSTGTLYILTISSSSIVVVTIQWLYFAHSLRQYIIT